MTAPGMRARVASSAKPVTRRKYFPNLLIFNSPFSRLKLEFVSLGQPGPNFQVCFHDLSSDPPPRRIQVDGLQAAQGIPCAMSISSFFRISNSFWRRRLESLGRA